LAEAVQILPFDNQAAAVAGQLRAELEAQGTPIGPYDILIAATALTNSSPLVTHNRREFERIPQLALVDWY
jgi:tRNA(fMet)-specific endonuclease VapC